MISPRYLNDKVDSNDAKRSILKILPYSAFAFIVLCLYHLIPVLSLIIAPDFKRQQLTEKYVSALCFSDAPSYFITLGMTACGILMAVTLFKFLLTKKSVNVILSVGITRKRLYFNRILAAVVSLFLCTFIPLLITFIINAFSFGLSAHLLYSSCFIFLTTFSYGLSGFALTCVGMTISGCLAEALVTTIGASFIPLLLGEYVKSCPEMLRGFVYEFVSSQKINTVANLFCIWAHGVNLDTLKSNEINDGLFNTPLQLIGGTIKKGELDASNQVGWGVLFPVLLWLVFSIGLILLGWIFMDRRKNENSNSFGKIYASSAINGFTVSTVIISLVGTFLANLYGYYYSDFFGKLFYQNSTTYIFALMLACFIAFFIAELIIRRNFKATLRTLPVLAVSFVIVIACTVYTTTQHFGTFNKLPAESEISTVSMDILDDSDMFSYYARNLVYSSNNADDIKTAIKMFEKAKADTYYKGSESNAEKRICFHFTLKDGSEILREFKMFTPEVVTEYKKTVYSTNYYKNYLKRILIDEPKASPDDDSYDYDRYDYMYSYGALEPTPGAARLKEWYYVSDKFAFNNYKEDLCRVTSDPIEDVDGLLKAVYNDLITMSYDELYHSNQRPIGCLMLNMNSAWCASDKLVCHYGYLHSLKDYNSWNGVEQSVTSNKPVCGVSSCEIMIYPQMTQTIAFLKQMDEQPLPFDAKIKEIYVADCDLHPSGVQFLAEKNKGIKTPYYYGEAALYRPDYLYYGTSIFDDKEDGFTISVIDCINEIHNTAGVKLNKITDTAKANEIVSKSVPFFTNDIGDKGRYIYIVYDNDVIIMSYIPQANIGVLA